MRRFALAGLFSVALVSVAMAQPKPAPPAAPPAGAQNSSFNLVNRSPQAIRELFVTSAGNANWGQNRLDGKSGNPTAIAAGASYAVRRKLDTNCVFDIRAVFADGKAEERKALNTCAIEDVPIGATPVSNVPVAATGKPADDPSFKLFNRSARPITELRALPSGGGAVAASPCRATATASSRSASSSPTAPPRSATNSTSAKSPTSRFPDRRNPQARSTLPPGLRASMIKAKSRGRVST